MNAWTSFWITAACAGVVACSSIYVSKNVTIGDVFGYRFVVVK